MVWFFRTLKNKNKINWELKFIGIKCDMKNIEVKYRKCLAIDVHPMWIKNSPTDLLFKVTTKKDANKCFVNVKPCFNNC